MPSGIALGPDNNIWFTESVPNAAGTAYVAASIGVINPATRSLITEISQGLPANSHPSGIAAGPDGSIWFTESTTGNIGQIRLQTDVTRDSIIRTLAVPKNVVASPNPVGITAGPDGNMWFTDPGGAIGEVNLSQLPTPVVSAAPSSVVAGQAFGVVITVKNGSAGTVDQDFNGTVSLSLGNNPGGTSSPLGGGQLTVTATNGVATFSGLTLDVAASGYTLNATLDGLPSVSTGGFLVLPGAVTKLIVTAQPPTTVAVGQGFGLSVFAYDQFNNIATNFSGTATVSVASGTAVPGGTTSLNFSPSSSTPGEVTFSGLTLSNVGTGVQLRINVGAALSTSTIPFTVSAGAPLLRPARRRFPANPW